MVAPVLVRPCLPAELPGLIELLDEEFVLSKGRRVSLARRLPAVLQAGNCANVQLACRDGRIAGAVVVKHFDWITPGRSRRGAMIGLVYTRPAERGHGFASLLLRSLATKLGAAGSAFAVLFTAQPAFYRRLGWTGSDCGIFGTCASAGGAAANCPPAAVAAIDDLRLRNPGAHVARDQTSYRTLPLPSERLEMRVSPDGAAYAIYGLQADRAYVYELGGDPPGFPALWQDINAAARMIHVNEREGSAAHRWLAAVRGISWQKQELAMWLPLAEADCARHFGDWYIPYLDRI